MEKLNNYIDLLNNELCGKLVISFKKEQDGIEFSYIMDFLDEILEPCSFSRDSFIW